ncbi:MAG: hypothetical protein Q8R47_06350 [Nanoarchaeota archaeon]|nr:hypothetical protein [Nanoarchaeota archaeon]
MVNRTPLLLIILGLLTVLFVTSCATKYVCTDGSTVSDPDLCPKTTEEIKEPVSNQGLSIEELLMKSRNVESMSYDYKRVDKPLEKPVDVWIKKLIIKQRLNVQTEVLNKNTMDAVIFDTGATTAQAICESKKYCIKTGDAGPVDYDQYYVKTPLDWIDGVASAEKISEAKIGTRNVWQLRTPEGVSLWVDTYYGVPLRVDVGNERHEFQNVLFNGVQEKDVQFAERDLIQ